MKKTPLALFRWDRPVGGFAWEDGAPAFPGPESAKLGTRFLVEQSKDQPLIEPYNPLTTFPTLYQMFAMLEPTEEQFLMFANKYGSLGVGVLLKGKPMFVVADSLKQWQREHWRLRRVADVIVAIRDGDAATLRQWFTITHGEASYERQQHGSQFLDMARIADRKHNNRTWLLDWAIAADSDDEALLRIAQGWAQDAVNAALSGERHHAETVAHAHIVFDLDSHSMGLHVVPKNLIAAMWLQCARVLTDNPTLKSCAHCQRQFEVAPGTRRKQSLYCSHNCKIAAYRARKAATIPMACPHCAETMIVECEVGAGFGQMKVYAVECPHCHNTFDRQLPNGIIDVRVADNSTA